jgi:ABC-type multidrug transport system fused ATPase/permease subunit
MALPEVSRHKVSSEDGTVSIEDGEFTWTNEYDPILKDIALSFPFKSLTLVCGSIGAAKSPLFAALLQEMKQINGQVKIPFRISYAPQKAWIFTGTVRENILFYEEYDEERYSLILDVCELKHDVLDFHASDMTVIGERGVNISGGQRRDFLSQDACIMTQIFTFLMILWLPLIQSWGSVYWRDVWQQTAS